MLFIDFSKAFDSIHREKILKILLSYGIPTKTVKAISMLYQNTLSMVRSPDRDTDFFDISAGVLQGDTLAPYIFIICLYYILRWSIDENVDLGFTLEPGKSKRYPWLCRWSSCIRRSSKGCLNTSSFHWNNGKLRRTTCKCNKNRIHLFKLRLDNRYKKPKGSDIKKVEDTLNTSEA